MGHNSARQVVAAGLPDLYPRLWRFCLVQTKTRHGADDLAQAACARALDNATKFDPSTHLDRWVFTIARRLWLNEIRATNVRQGQGVVDVAQTEIAEPAPDVEVNILAREVFDLVQALPDGQRLTTVLVYVEGYSYKEAAEMLDIPIGTVMSRLAAARKTIAKQTAEQGLSCD